MTGSPLGSAEPASARRPVFAANWKMNLLRADAEAFVDRLKAGTAASDPGPERDVALFPPHVLIPRVVDRLTSDQRFAVGGQDLHPEADGPHTGDVSAAQLKDAGAGWVICGHSERRAEHHESDQWVGRKLLAALQAGLTTILCIGETQDEREGGTTREILARQLDGAGIAATGRIGTSSSTIDSLVVAYEPVWAIGTGKSATAQLAQETHGFLRHDLARRLGPSVAESIRLLYGGSVKPANCRELFAQPDIDGFLIGGSSLDPGSFLDIIGRCGF